MKKNLLKSKILVLTLLAYLPASLSSAGVDSSGGPAVWVGPKFVYQCESAATDYLTWTKEGGISVRPVTKNQFILGNADGNHMSHRGPNFSVTASLSTLRLSITASEAEIKHARSRELIATRSGAEISAPTKVGDKVTIRGELVMSGRSQTLGQREVVVDCTLTERH